MAIEMLQAKNPCPKCGVAWEVVKGMLAEGIKSENYWLAEYIINNCSKCKKHFGKEGNNG
jgi:hypothetical protein